MINYGVGKAVVVTSAAGIHVGILSERVGNEVLLIHPRKILRPPTDLNPEPELGFAEFGIGKLGTDFSPATPKTNLRQNLAWMLRIAPYYRVPCVCLWETGVAHGCPKHDPMLADVHRLAREAFLLEAAVILAEAETDADCCAGYDESGNIIVVCLQVTNHKLGAREYRRLSGRVFIRYTLQPPRGWTKINHARCLGAQE